MRVLSLTMERMKAVASGLQRAQARPVSSEAVASAAIRWARARAAYQAACIEMERARMEYEAAERELEAVASDLVRYRWADTAAINQATLEEGSGHAQTG